MSLLFAAGLADWVVTRQIKECHVDALFKLLKTEENLSNLPKTCKSLLKTVRKTNLKPVFPVMYFHFGIRKCLEKQLNLQPSVPKVIRMQVNIDGLPLAKTSGSQFYPILGLVLLNSKSNPFVFGIYHGYDKPKDPNELLSDYVSEMDYITQHGLSYRVNVHVEHTVKVHISAIICDAPAKAFILNTKYHTAFHSCTKCTQRGEWAGRVVF